MAAPQSGRGINQYELYDIFALIRTNIIGVLTKLDADTGVADTNYLSGNTFTFDRTFSRVAVRDQSDWLKAMDKIRAAFNAMLTKLDADGTVNSTDYNSTYAIADYTNVRSSADLLDAGQMDGAQIKWLKTFLDKWNLALAHLDADSGVSGTNYASLWGITAAGKVDATGARLKVG